MLDVLAAIRALDAWAFLWINRSLQNPFFDLLMPILSTKEYALVRSATSLSETWTVLVRPLGPITVTW